MMRYVEDIAIFRLRLYILFAGATKIHRSQYSPVGR